MGGRRALDLHLRDKVDFSKIRFFYMEGVRHTPTVQYLSCEMRAALLKAVSHFEEKFDIEAICLDLPLLTKAIEMSFASMQAEGSPKISEIFMSLKGDRGNLNWLKELPKVLSGKSVHTPGALLFAFIESTDRTCEEEKAEHLHLRDRLSRQISELLGSDGILLFPSWPITAPYHHQGIFAPFDFAYTCVFNALTLPALQCPIGLDSKGLPLGVQLVASYNCEWLLIAAAQQLSNAFGGWTPVWK
ncbi:hypothetical protein OESDEN_09303 [Oesophagostomum dentatum]|uniref:Amidase domain-containing protein n=1 Tax=Oesophagostomum dentatum TaxID=61180 RepID=A0A0B1T3W3_OESDE|nr:hypothetical protein OESDEN_09303 [Oesophagostomum dentatum]